MPFKADSVADLVRKASQGAFAPLQDFLLRRGGVPGPRPNFKLLLTVAHGVHGEGKAGCVLRDKLLSFDFQQAPVGSAFPVLAMAGVVTLGVAAGQSDDPSKLLQVLHDHADDPRREVRDAVVFALSICLEKRPSSIEALEGWADGYFHGELVSRALSESEVLQRFDDAKPIVDWLQRMFDFVEEAPRAHQRSQGYRALVRSMSGLIVAAGNRFPETLIQWVEDHAPRATEDLLATMNDALDRLRAGGFRRGHILAVHEALQATTPSPRDPRSDVGPTRGRGKKARRKGR